MNLLRVFLLVLSAGAGSTYALAGSAPLVAASAQDALTPGPEHALLQKLVGTWDAVLVAPDPTGKEQRTPGTLTTTKSTEFHTVDSFQGTLMGMPMLGHGINGYCPVRKQYYRFWTDSMTPTPMVLWGDYDAAKRELTLRGECFGMSGKLEKCRTVTRWSDDDHLEWALFGPGPDGKEMQHLRIEYTRRK